MGTPPNPSPNTFPNRGSVPNPNPGPIQTAAPGVKSPSFEEVSKLFSLPLSDAAESLGVCPSVLKKVCYDNGLFRWPYRNFLAGKSIEEIKKEAAVEKEKQNAKLKVVPERNVSSASPAVSTSLTPQPHTSFLQEHPAPQMRTQQPNRDNQIASFHTMNKGSAPSSDEFKYGFPLNGLSSISYRWWGNKGDIENGSCVGDAERKQQPKDSVDSGANLSSTKTTEGKKNETDADSQWESSLSALRKRVAKEGQRTVKLGVYRDYNVKTLDRGQKMMLLQIFKSSLPCEWGDISSER